MLIRLRGCRVTVVLSACALVLAAQAATAQQPRTRTLTYSPDSKDWVEQPPPPPGTSAGDLHAIRVQIKDGKYRAALKAVKKFVKDFGASDPYYPQILIAQAEALVARRDYYKAHTMLQAFLSEFGGMARTSEALRLEFVIAETFLSGVKRKLWGLRLLSGTDVALEILDEIAADYPESTLAELAMKTKADYLFAQGDHALAELEYGRMLREYPQSRYHRFCLRRTADSALASFAGIHYDATALAEAADRYREYRQQYPGAPDLADVERVLTTIPDLQAEKEYAISEYYERTGHLGSAVYYYRMVRENWPDTIAAAKAARRLELLGASEPVSPPGTGQRAPDQGNMDQRSNG